MIRAFPVGWTVARFHKASFPTHRAYDIFGREGAPLYAVEAGVVSRHGPNAVGGHMVLLRAESGRLYSYTHNREAGRFPSGTAVAAGTRIATLGQTGNAPSPHVHFQAVSPQGIALDVYDELRAVQFPSWARTYTATGAFVLPARQALLGVVLAAGGGYLGRRHLQRAWRIVRA